MMKSQLCASPLRPSKLCRLLLFAVGIKLCLLGGMLLEPFLAALPLTTAGSPASMPGPGKEAAVESAKTALPEVKLPVSRSVAYAAPAVAPPTDNAAQPEQSGTLAREALARRQEELARKEQDLRALERDLNDRLERMQALEARLQVMLNEAAEIRSAKFRQVVDVMSNMKARQAASMLETLDEKIAVKVLAGMRGRQAGEILTFVETRKAARLAEALARMQLPLE